MQAGQRANQVLPRVIEVARYETLKVMPTAVSDCDIPTTTRLDSQTVCCCGGGRWLVYYHVVGVVLPRLGHTEVGAMYSTRPTHSQELCQEKRLAVYVTLC